MRHDDVRDVGVAFLTTEHLKPNANTKLKKKLPPAPTLRLAVPAPPFWPFFCLWPSELQLCS